MRRLLVIFYLALSVSLAAAAALAVCFGVFAMWLAFAVAIGLYVMMSAAQTYWTLREAKRVADRWRATLLKMAAADRADHVAQFNAFDPRAHLDP